MWLGCDKGRPSDKQDSFLVCLLFMGNNEFNLIFRSAGGGVTEGLKWMRQKMKLIFYKTIRKHWDANTPDWSVFGPFVALTKPSITLLFFQRCVSPLTCTFFIRKISMEISLVLSIRRSCSLRHIFSWTTGRH